MSKKDDENRNLLGAHFTFSGCPTIEMNISGNCPVQAWGKISDNNPDKFYFRARHDSWSFEVYDVNNESNIIFYAEGDYINSSWMPIDVALKIIGEQILLFWRKQDDLGGAHRRIKRVWGDALLKKFRQEAAKGKKK